MTLEPKNGSRPPPALYAAALQHEHQRHARRLAELKALEPRLRMLDALAGPLTEQGLTLHPEQISATGWEISTRGARPTEVWLSAGMTDSAGRLLFAALRAVGFTLEIRRDHGASSSVTLKHGRLRVRTWVDAKVLDTADPPPLASSGTAATEGAAP
jgi:hypothetical protein